MCKRVALLDKQDCTDVGISMVYVMGDWQAFLTGLDCFSICFSVGSEQFGKGFEGSLGWGNSQLAEVVNDSRHRRDRQNLG